MELAMVNGFNVLSEQEMLLVDGGEWEWKEFGKAVAEGALGGAIDGAIGGTVTLPGIGTVAGAAGMGAVGAVIGAVVYAAVGWW